MDGHGAPAIHGDCDERFAAVRDAFARIFPEQGEVGAAFAVTIGGEIVVDLWAGHRDARRTLPWQHDTIVNLYSCSKAVTATSALRLVDEGRIDLDEPVARYWPEFGQAGKEHLPVRFLFTHEAALPAVDRLLPEGTNFDWDAMCEALAQQAPWWEPGTTHGYHTNTFGYLLGELVRRVDGRSLGAYWRDEIARPWGIDFMIGFGPEEDHRVAELLPSARRDGDPPPRLRRDGPPHTMQEKAGGNPAQLSGQGVINTRRWRAAEVPSTNGHGNARALAQFYGALVCGDPPRESATTGAQRILSAELLDEAVREHAYGTDANLGRVTRFGLGYQLTMAERPLGPNPRGFGHFGAAGSLGFADPDAGIGIGYSMNRGRTGWQHRHVRELIDLVYTAL
jgi:CubicO group peptidase (beta-lactamase class C family)